MLLKIKKLKKRKQVLLMTKASYPKVNDKANKGYLLNLILTDEQREILNNCFRASRYAWNLFLGLNEYLYLENLQENHPDKFNELKVKAYDNANPKNSYRRQLKFFNQYLAYAENQEVYEIAQNQIKRGLKRIEKYNLAHPDKPQPVEMPHLSEYDMKTIITALKKRHQGEPGYELTLSHVAATVPRSAVADLDKAYQAFWRNLKRDSKRAGKPRFKSRFASQTCGFTEGVKALALHQDNHGMLLSVPKVGKIKCHSKRHIPKGIVKQLRIILTPNGHIHASLTMEQKTATPLNLNKVQDAQTMGLNMNYSDNVVTLSDGTTYQMDFAKLEYAQSRVDYWSKHLAMRKNRYDKRYAILKNKLTKEKKLYQLPVYNPYSVSGVRKAQHARANAHARLANLRKYWWTQLVTELTRKYKILYVPKYNMMSLKAKDKHNKRLLNLSGIGLLLPMLKAQSRKNGCHIIEVDSPYVTQTCHYCGTVNTSIFGTKDKPKVYTKPTWVCEHCHRELKLHQNAAINAKKFGTDQFIADRNAQIKANK